MSIVVGPWGGNGGSYWDDGSYNGVREISLAYGRCIDSICVGYDQNGKPVAAEKHGGVGGNRTTEVSLIFRLFQKCFYPTIKLDNLLGFTRANDSFLL